MKPTKTFCPECGIAYREAWTVCNRAGCPMLDDAQATPADEVNNEQPENVEAPDAAVRAQEAEGGGVES